MPPLTDASLHLHGRRSCELFRAVFTGPNRPPNVQLTLLVHPIPAGTGRHLSGGGSRHVPLTILQSRPHSNGVVALR